MELSYKDKLRLVRDEQFGSLFEERESIKSLFQKGLLGTVIIFMIIYLSKL